MLRKIMNTQSHIILNLWLIKKVTKTTSKDHKPITLGALLPDIPMFLFFLIAALILQQSRQTIWQESYFQTNWQLFFNLFNSIPFFLLIALVAYIYQKRSILLIAASGVLHALGDLPLHQEYAHAHFLPFTNWKFYSPITYWKTTNNGRIVKIIETLLVLLASIDLWKEIESKTGKNLIILANLLNISDNFLGFLSLLIT